MYPFDYHCLYYLTNEKASDIVVATDEWLKQRTSYVAVNFNDVIDKPYHMAHMPCNHESRVMVQLLEKLDWQSQC